MKRLTRFDIGTATVSNYEYILAFILDQAANIHVEVRATGILSTMPIDDGVELPWAVRVGDGVAAAYHQHLFSLRIDPAIDGFNNSVVYEDSVPIDDPVIDPMGVGYRTVNTTITKPGGYSLDIDRNRVYKIINPSSINPVSGRPAGYKLHAFASQMMLTRPKWYGYQRATFCQKPIWVTKYRDDELYAAGEFTNQSQKDSGLSVWAARNESTQNQDVVLWHTFGLTHNPRPEDFPVMPMEMIGLTLRPVNFFTESPSIDAPRSDQVQNQSVLVNRTCHNL